MDEINLRVITQYYSNGTIFRTYTRDKKGSDNGVWRSFLPDGKEFDASPYNHHEGLLDHWRCSLIALEKKLEEMKIDVSDRDLAFIVILNRYYVIISILPETIKIDQTMCFAMFSANTMQTKYIIDMCDLERPIDHIVNERKFTNGIFDHYKVGNIINDAFYDSLACNRIMYKAKYQDAFDLKNPTYSEWQSRSRDVARIRYLL